MVNFFVTNGQSFGRFTANDQRHLDSLIVLLNEGTQLAWAVFSGTLKVFGAIHISNRWHDIPKLYFTWERNWHEIAFKYFIFKKRNYYFTANTQTNISKLATKSAKQVSYILLKSSMAYDQGSRPYPRFRSKFRSREDFNIYINNGKRCIKVWSKSLPS